MMIDLRTPAERARDEKQADLRPIPEIHQRDAGYCAPPPFPVYCRRYRYDRTRSEKNHHKRRAVPLRYGENR